MITFGSNVAPKRRIRSIRRGAWKCACVVAGKRLMNSYYLTQYDTCGMKRP